MKLPSFFLSLVLLGSALVATASAEPRTLFFAKETAKESTRIAITIDGDQVGGTQIWQPKGEAHGSRGTFSGTIQETGLIKVVHTYTIEGSEQSEEEVFKMDGDQLLIGEGELVEQKGGLLKFKEPNQISFKKALAQVAIHEPKAGSPERKAIMEAMRGPVIAHAGKAVVFTGQVRSVGAWARFQGSVAIADGSKPSGDLDAGDLDLAFFALLKKDAKGRWQVLHWGFAGDIGISDEAREKYPKAPWVMFD